MVSMASDIRSIEESLGVDLRVLLELIALSFSMYLPC
jgi:hypothetical protein